MRNSRIWTGSLVELARIFHCSKSKIARDLADAGSEWPRRHDYLRRKDRGLEIQWEDFLELCRVASPACLGRTS